MSAIKTIHEINGTVTTEDIMKNIATMDTHHIALLDSPAIAHAYGDSMEPEGCGARDCVRIACGSDPWRDYTDGYNTGGRLYDDNGDPRDVGVPAGLKASDCDFFRGVDAGWRAAEYHRLELCVAPVPDDLREVDFVPPDHPDMQPATLNLDPDLLLAMEYAPDGNSLMDNDQPEPGLGEGFGPDDECAWVEHYDDNGRYTEDVFHIMEPEDVCG